MRVQSSSEMRFSTTELKQFHCSVTRNISDLQSVLPYSSRCCPVSPSVSCLQGMSQSVSCLQGMSLSVSCLQGMLRSRGRRLLFADADGATKFADIEKLEAELTKLELSSQARDSTISDLCDQMLDKFDA